MDKASFFFMITLDTIRKSYAYGFIPKRAEILRGISLQVQKGEVFGFLGPNGAGKTTTMKILMNLLKSDSGSASINGIDVSKPAARMAVGYLPEQPYFYDYLTGSEFLDYCARLFKISKLKRHKRSNELLEKVGLAEAKDNSLRTYSRGMLQRIGIAQALINEPEILILDEPLSGLDPQGRKEVLDIIVEQKKLGKTILFSSHILADAEMFCDSIGILNDGKLKAEGELNSIMEKENKSAKVEIVFQSEDISVLNEFQNYGKISRIHGNKYLIKVDDSIESNTIISLLTKRGLPVLSVNRHRITLEELYLKKLNTN